MLMLAGMVAEFPHDDIDSFTASDAATERRRRYIKPVSTACYLIGFRNFRCGTV